VVLPEHPVERPARVFDDLYFLGQTAFSVWALKTTEGFILVDAIFDYSVEAEVIEGLRKLGLDPAQIRYVIISHAHGDHSGGAGILQRHGARIVMSEVDWALYEKSNEKDKARRDIVATDGMALTLGDPVRSGVPRADDIHRLPREPYETRRGVEGACAVRCVPHAPLRLRGGRTRP
jgi:glyoxylase-like metal-dependent hydrolase (beta-lactamase superfamily II)